MTDLNWHWLPSSYGWFMYFAGVLAGWFRFSLRRWYRVRRYRRYVAWVERQPKWNGSPYRGCQP